MASSSMDVIVEKRLKWHKTETILLWLIIAMAVIFIPAGIAIYLNVDTLAITQYISAGFSSGSFSGGFGLSE